MDFIQIAIVLGVLCSIAKVFRIFWLEMLCYGAFGVYLAINLPAIFGALMSFAG
jgi:hypothetical protein